MNDPMFYLGCVLEHKRLQAEAERSARYLERTGAPQAAEKKLGEAIKHEAEATFYANLALECADDQPQEDAKRTVEAVLALCG